MDKATTARNSLFGARLKELRKSRNLTQQQFCKQYEKVTGCILNINSISNWENGYQYPSPDSRHGIYIEYWGMNTRDYLQNKERKRQAYKDPTHFTIRLRRTTVHRIMAAAAMLIVAFTIIVPNYGTLNLNGKFQAQMASAESLITLFYNNPHPIAQPIAETTPHFVTGQTEEAHTASTVNTAEEEVPVAQEIPVVEEKTVPAEHQEETTPQPEEADIIQEEVVTHPQNIAPVQEEVISHTEEQASPATIAGESTSLEVKGYCVVMASAITHKGAELLIEKLNREGFTNAVKYNDKGMLRVVLTGYPNEAAARAEMAVVRVTDKLYSGSWLKHF
jgi:transcriptional regulator with XRE-family HTH domain